MSSSPTFGIDLGTTCSAIGWVRDGRPELIPIDGDVLVPSVVAFDASAEAGQVLVGQAAANQQLLAPEHTLHSTKRRMGSDHRWTVGERSISAPEVATEILRYLAQGAELATGIRPEQVVVTVPAWFPHDARSDTQRAAEAAGLVVKRLINEPTAAALAHAHGQPQQRLALVYDFGGGTFDASLVHQQGELIEVRASQGDVHLGGDDLDGRLIAHLLERLRSEDPALASVVRSDPGARLRFLIALRAAKHELSSSLSATVRAPFLGEVRGEARHLEMLLDRDVVEAELAPLLDRTFDCIDSVLEDAGIAAAEVDDLLLVGGASRAPIVHRLLEERFGWSGSAAVPPDRAVGLGAAIQGAIVDGGKVDQMLLDVTPYALSVATVDPPTRRFITSVITPRNAPLPGRHTHRFYTIDPYQQRLDISVLQGSHPNPLRNVPLGKLEITDLPPAPAEDRLRPIAVEFRQDLSGLVSVRVTDELSGRTVDGEVVVGGEESAQARQLLVHAIEVDGLIPGDGSDPDPYLEREEPGLDGIGSAPDEAAAASQAAPDLDEAAAAFRTLLQRQAQLASDHPEHALALRQLATRGEQALESNDAEGALERYDELSDRMFELGIYL